jgi:hypothetical protein
MNGPLIVHSQAHSGGALLEGQQLDALYRCVGIVDVVTGTRTDRYFEGDTVRIPADQARAILERWPGLIERISA